MLNPRSTNDKAMPEYSSAKSLRPFGFFSLFVLFVMVVSLNCAQGGAKGPSFGCNLPSHMEEEVCAWKTAKTFKQKIEEASMSWIARVKLITKDRAKSEIFQNATVTNSHLEVLCVLKGAEVPGYVILSETGVVMTRCFDFEAEAGKTYVINAFKQDGFFCPYGEALPYEDYKDEIASLCHLNFTPPQGIIWRANVCPAKADSCDGNVEKARGQKYEGDEEEEKEEEFDPRYF